MYPLYNSQIKLNEVALNVNHLLQETEFYTKKTRSSSLE